MVVFSLNSALGYFEQNTAVKDVVDRVEAFYELICSLSTPGYLSFLDLIVFDKVTHEVLNNVTLALLQSRLLHELEDPQIIDHILNVPFTPHIKPCLLELLVGEPLFLVVGPFAQHEFLAA